MTKVGGGHEVTATTAPTVIPSQDTLIADLLSLDLSVPSAGVPPPGSFLRRVECRFDSYLCLKHFMAR